MHLKEKKKAAEEKAATFRNMLRHIRREWYKKSKKDWMTTFVRPTNTDSSISPQTPTKISEDLPPTQRPTPDHATSSDNRGPTPPPMKQRRLLGRMSSISDQFEAHTSSDEVEEVTPETENRGNIVPILESSEDEQPANYVCTYQFWMDNGVAKRQLLTDNGPAGPSKIATSTEDVEPGEEFITVFPGGTR